MEITVQAFELKTGKGISLQHFGDHLKTLSVSSVKNRYIYVDRTDGWWHGLLLTARNIKAFARMERQGGRVILSPESIKNGELAHFNFFLVHEKFGRGLYQYYHGSSSVHGFAQVLKQHYNGFKKQCIERDCLAENILADSPPKKITKRYAGYLVYQLVLRRKSFEALMKELRGVRKVSLQFVEYEPHQRLFRSLAGKAKAVQHNLTFGNKYDGSIRDDLVELANTDILKTLSGVGIDDNDVERRFRLLNEPESLGNFDFNDIVLSTEFDSEDVHSSLERAPVLSKMKTIAESDNWLMGKI
ncbi:hypothetical protein Despr_2453 [Desulfobulbus propionicus DSM 2032]|uniref:Uncharacterized protein n=1 Tax=Desulfobulbus propionicus (strain ATCC 33891 / DSM 2032 / VKM B-1956 / 1pr3) TaxID=577650 RepID=A0A7U4DQ00_DESPD|nr:hypothetical protein [Desulfobulbus propionicus]ADW18592.1 hypothetical protein Despr_2453 [Desulfobulbus propionicus DSM 2032]